MSLFHFSALILTPSCHLLECPDYSVGSWDVSPTINVMVWKRSLHLEDKQKGRFWVKPSGVKPFHKLRYDKPVK